MERVFESVVSPHGWKISRVWGARVVVWVRGSVRFFATVARARVTLHPRTHHFPTSRSEEKLTSKCCYDVGKYDSGRDRKSVV